jgi:tRNA-2-methylthio-N6-dimethylallyladenosine synthase
MNQYFEPIMQAMANLPKVCHALHIPAQSGSDTILKAMNRNYTAQAYLALLNKARALVPDIALAGDFIVGFPGETDQDFQNTLDLVHKARYRNCYVFKYSPRPGTASDKRLQDTVPDYIKQQRNTALLSAQEGISDTLSRHYQDREVKVLVEGLSKKSHTHPTDDQGHPQLAGRTATDWIVVFHGPVSLAGQFTTVRIEKTSPLTLFGRLT